ncbi:hypothetical protein ACQKQA_18775 [Pseudomonas sp. NPDC089530]|uniref:hypothetical protein n=1 Tax=Pseudomonas sp. NPDC089530 TaxID=3390651 RepID=UPI003D00F344
MKGMLIGTYLAIALVVGTLGAFFGNYSYESYWYNLGRGFLWPVGLFEGDTEIDGDTPESFAKSYVQMMSEHKNSKGRYLLPAALGKLAGLELAKADPSLVKADFAPLITGGAVPQVFIQGLLKNPKIVNSLREELDGMDFHDMLIAGDDAEAELFDLLDERDKANRALAEALQKVEAEKTALQREREAETARAVEVAAANAVVATQSSQACVDDKISAYRAEVGEESLVTHDMLAEWEGECASSY